MTNNANTRPHTADDVDTAIRTLVTWLDDEVSPRELNTYGMFSPTDPHNVTAYGILCAIEERNNVAPNVENADLIDRAMLEIRETLTELSDDSLEVLIVDAILKLEDSDTLAD
jgi:hypothetical protein